MGSNSGVLTWTPNVYGKCGARNIFRLSDVKRTGVKTQTIVLTFEDGVLEYKPENARRFQEFKGTLEEVGVVLERWTGAPRPMLQSRTFTSGEAAAATSEPTPSTECLAASLASSAQYLYEGW